MWVSQGNKKPLASQEVPETTVLLPMAASLDTVARSGLVGETYASRDAIRTLKMYQKNTIYMNDYKKEWHRKTLITLQD